MNLKELRLKAGLTQENAAKMFDLSRKTYISYENDESKADSIKYKYMINSLKELTRVDTEHGILSLDDIKEGVVKVLNKYNVKYCYLFGAYANNNAKEDSGVNFLIDGNINDLMLLSLNEELKLSLNKIVQVLTVDKIINNKILISEIINERILIYQKD